MRITRRITYELLDSGRLPNEEDMAHGFEPFEAVSCAADWMSKQEPATLEDHDVYSAFMERLADLCPALRERFGPSIGPIKGVD